jgi:hypothetical protein
MEYNIIDGERTFYSESGSYNDVTGYQFQPLTWSVRAWKELKHQIRCSFKAVV